MSININGNGKFAGRQKLHEKRPAAPRDDILRKLAQVPLPSFFTHQDEKSRHNVIGLLIDGDQEPNDIVSGFLILMGKERGERYLRQLSKNVITRRGRSLLVELLTAGEFPISIDVYAHRVSKAIKDGAPLAAAPVPANFSFPSVSAILKRAPHPENAKLWIDWLQSPAGQEVIAQRSRSPVGKTEGTPDPTAALIKGREQVVLLPSKLPMPYEAIAKLAREIF